MRTTLACRVGMLGLLISTLAVAAVAAGRVEVARDSETDFSTYASYGFRFKEGLNPKNALASETPIYQSIVKATDQSLVRRGMVRDQEAPDLWIEFQGVLQEGLSIEGGAHKSLGGGVTWVGDPNAFSMQTIRTGTLIAEVYDRESGERVWSAWTSENAPSGQKLRKRAPKAAKRIFSEFPR